MSDTTDDTQERAARSREFSERVHEALAREVPTEGEIPLVYIGSGGDLRTAMRVSSTNKIIMVDRTPFLSRTGYDVDGRYDTTKDMIVSAKSKAQRVGGLAADSYMAWSRVSPGSDIIRSIMERGVDADEIDIQNHEDGSASVKFAIGSKTYNVDYICENIAMSGRLEDVLAGRVGLRNGHYGLMTKAGLKLAELVSDFAGRAAEYGSDIAPQYIVCDDPRALLNVRLTPEMEAEFFPGYALHEVIDKNTSTKWVYSMGNMPGYDPSVYGAYGARAVVCVREP